MTQSAQLLTLTVESAGLSQVQILTGYYVQPYRSKKGKLKGLVLQGRDGDFCIKLPKYLRPMLARELVLGAYVRVWAYQDGDIWRAINLLLLEEHDIATLCWSETVPASTLDQPEATATNVTTPNPPKRCIQVCRKGKCYKQGSKHIWHALQAEVEANPALQHISIEATGCMKACKKGPNLKVMPKGKMISGVTPQQALAVLADCQ